MLIFNRMITDNLGHLLFYLNLFLKNECSYTDFTHKNPYPRILQISEAGWKA